MSFSQLQDTNSVRMYDEEEWWLDSQQNGNINPSHFDLSTPTSPPSVENLKPKKPSLVRTLSRKFVKNIISPRDNTGRQRLTAALLSDYAKRDMDDEERHYFAKRHLFDPEVWLKEYTATKDPILRSRLRMFVQDTTRQAGRSEHYWAVAVSSDSHLYPPKRIPIIMHDYTLENVQMIDYGATEPPSVTQWQGRFSGTAHFVYSDAVDVGVFMKRDQKCDPLVLVFASPTLLGGPDKGGGISQEESFLRRTNVATLVNNEVGRSVHRNWIYRLPRYGGLYVPSAAVFRSNAVTGFKFLIDPIKLPLMLAAAPLNEPAFKVCRSGDFLDDWRRRIDSVLTVALEKGHDSLVLGAWGSGEMGNDPKQVAALWKEALVLRFRGCFKHVVFSFLRDPAAFQAYGQEFGAPKMPSAKEVETFNRVERKKRVVELPVWQEWRRQGRDNNAESSGSDGEDVLDWNEC